MTYTVRQRQDFVEALDRLLRSGREPRAILLSGGGNDIAGDEFHMLLEHARSPSPGLNADVVRGVVHVRIQNAYLTLLSAITDDCQARLGRAVPILVHGYDYPIPDGRGFCFGPFPGPWLKPGFDRKGYPERDIEPKRDLMRVLIDDFNRMIGGVAQVAGLPHVRYVNLRGSLPAASWWANELHPTRAGFEAVAARFARVLANV
jgi:lysophospholipase L1-like esterase